MDFSTISLVIQWVGVLVVVGLLLFLTQSIRRHSLDCWTAAWCCLAVALAALYLDFRSPAPHHVLRALYFLSEYAFGFLLVAGCRAFASPSPARRAWRWLPPGMAVALLLTWVADDFNLQFALHAAIVAALLFTAFLALAPARRQQGGPGLTVMSVSLFLLAVDFFHYVPVFAVAAYLGYSRRFAYLSFTSSIDLILETVLGFGMVMLTMESLRKESETANQELQQVLARLEILARTDPLTSALNRHAYHSLLAGAAMAADGAANAASAADLAGCIAVADVNGLKLINDRDGHLAGDAAIRQVATAIRSVIRADDLLFRWGGDEFLVILKHLDEDEAHRRFTDVNAVLAGAAPHDLSISFGIAPFGRAATIDEAIERADASMYRRKRGS